MMPNLIDLYAGRPPDLGMLPDAKQDDGRKRLGGAFGGLLGVASRIACMIG